MREWLRICEEKGYVKPAIYQGHYNAILRHPEADLFPLLREHGIKINAYGFVFNNQISLFHLLILLLALSQAASLQAKSLSKLRKLISVAVAGLLAHFLHILMSLINHLCMLQCESTTIFVKTIR